jgi:polyhydroxyalkanoate synthesis regulator phasin
LEELRQLASEITTAYDEERFHERMGLIIGRQEGTRYTITKLIPMSKFEVGTTRDNLYPNKDEIIEFIDKKTAVDEVVLGFYHNHSFERLRSGAKPGPSGVDVIGDDLNIPGYENKIVDDRLGLVLEPELDQNKLSVKDVAEFDPAQAEVLIHGYLSPQRGRVSPGIVSLGSTPLAAILQGLSPVGATASNAVKPLEILEVALEDRIAAREQLNRRTGGTLATTETLTTEGRLDQTLEGVQAPAGETSTGAVELEDLQKQIQGQLSKLIEGGLVNPAELIAQLSRFVESNVPKSAREAALRIAGEEVGKVINKGLPDPDQGYNHQILGDKQKERMAEGIAKKLGIAKDRVMRFWQGLDREGILGPMWVNEKGGVEASGVLQRLLEKFLEISGQKEGLAGNRIRDRLYHEYTHQILKAAMNENLQGQMKGFLEDKYHQEFMKAFSDRYGTNDPEEILAKYVSYTFTGEDKDLFEKETRDPETKEETGETVADKLGDMGILANVSFPRIVIRNEEAKQVVDELLKKSPGLSNRINKENPQRSLKEIMIEFRNLTAQGVKGENLPEEFRAVEDLLRPMLRETTLASLLIGEGGTSREEQQARLKALAKQAAPRINYEGQRQADQAVKRIMIHEASPVLNRVDTLVSDGTVARVGEAEDRNIFVLDILALVKKIGEKGGKVQFEGTGVGLDQALEKLFGVRPGTRIKLMSPYSEEQTQNILKNLGVPQELIGEGKGKIEVVGNWSEQGFEGIVRNALGVEKLEGESRERAEKDVVVVLSEETQKNLAAGREDQFREEIKGMKVVVGKLGKEKGAHSIGDVLGMALVLGSVEKAFDEKGQVSPVLAEKLKTLFEPILRDILKEQGVSETEIETQVSQIIKDIAKEGFFRIPPVTDVFNDMMRELAIEEAYIEVAA